MEFTWQITFIGEVEEVAALDNKKSQAVNIEKTEGEYKQSMAVKFRGDKTMLLGSYKQGDMVKVTVNHKSRESKKNPGSFGNNITAWKIEKVDAAPSAEPTPF